MEPAVRFVVIRIFDNELWLVARQFERYRTICRFTCFSIGPPLFVHLGTHRDALFWGHAVIVTLAYHAGHIVHCAGNDGFDARVHCGCAQRHATPAADTQCADILTIDIGLNAQKIDRSTEIFDVDIRRRNITWRATAFASVGRIERKRDKSTFCHGLGI